MSDVETLKEQLRVALETIAALQDPRPKHRHMCLDGPTGGEHVWFCSSPYCEPPFTATCKEHGGEPLPAEQRVGGQITGRWS